MAAIRSLQPGQLWIASIAGSPLRHSGLGPPIIRRLPYPGSGSGSRETELGIVLLEQSFDIGIIAKGFGSELPLG